MPRKNPNQVPLYAGLAGIQLDFDTLDLGDGIQLRRTYAYLMTPFLMAFAPAPPGKIHPAPWHAASGGFAYDIHAELFIPEGFAPSKWFDRVNTVWWFAALIRLAVQPGVLVPVLASEPFHMIPQLRQEPEFWPVEVGARRILFEKPITKAFALADLAWVQKNWLQGGRLMNQNTPFNTAFQAFDQAPSTGSMALYLVSMWGALEALFSPSPAELRFRVSATIASFLEPFGPTRRELQKTIAKLYDARSKAAHGSKDVGGQAVEDTHKLLQRVLVKIIESGKVPDRDDLEKLVLGGA